MAPMMNTRAINMPIFFTRMFNFIVLVFYCCYFGLFVVVVVVCRCCCCLSLQHLITHVWRDRLPVPAGAGKKKTPAFDQ